MRKEFTFVSCDGKTKIHAVKRIPDSGEIRGVLQIAHGMVEYIGRYQGFADFMEQHGFAVVGNDHLGHGSSVLTEEDLGYFREEDPSGALVEDMHTLRAMMQKEFPDVPYFMLGHSMGSYLLRQYIARHGEGLAGAILTGTGYADPKTTKGGLTLIRVLTKLRGSRHRSRMVQKLTYGKSYAAFDMTGSEPDRSWLTKDTAVVEKYYKDPLCTYLFTLNGYRGLLESVQFDCAQENVDRIPKDLPVLIASGADDPVGDLGEGVKIVDRMFRRAGIHDVTFKLYVGDRHEILNETDKAQVYDDILSWLTARIPSANQQEEER